MVNIKDFEEKKLIAGYCKVRSRKNNQPIINNSMYATWQNLWSDDFRVRGRCLKMHDNRFVTTKNKHQKSVAPSAFLKECTDCIASVTTWFNSTYDKKKGRKKNETLFKQMVLEYKKSCYEELIEKLKNSGLASAGYRLTAYALNNPTELSKFNLEYKIENEPKKFIQSGNYEQMLDIINKRHRELFVEELSRR